MRSLAPPEGTEGASVNPSTKSPDLPHGARVDHFGSVEVKSIAALLPIHQAQLLTYLKLTGLPVGLLINFNVERLVDGVKRVINPNPDPTRAAAVLVRKTA